MPHTHERNIMLVTNLEHANANNYLNERFAKAYAFLAQGNLEALPLGRNEIDGDDVFANVQEYDTLPASEKQFEAHRSYYDVQFVVSGQEMLQYAQLDTVNATQDFDEANDFCLYEASNSVTNVVLRAGDMAVLAPEDAHKPGCTLGDAPCHVRKIVVKVRA